MECVHPTFSLFPTSQLQNIPEYSCMYQMKNMKGITNFLSELHKNQQHLSELKVAADASYRVKTFAKAHKHNCILQYSLRKPHLKEDTTDETML